MAKGKKSKKKSLKKEHILVGVAAGTVPIITYKIINKKMKNGKISYGKNKLNQIKSTPYLLKLAKNLKKDGYTTDEILEMLGAGYYNRNFFTKLFIKSMIDSF